MFGPLWTAAALSCADMGARVTLVERRTQLGGLTRSFRHRDAWYDNGQHVFLRCCTAYLQFLQRIGAADDVVLQDRMSIPVLRPGGPRSSHGKACTVRKNIRKIISKKRRISSSSRASPTGSLRMLSA